VRQTFECVGSPEPLVPQTSEQTGLVRRFEGSSERGRPIVVEL